jgi:predicted alpha/beta superfamily hydrolase/Flp pilus assembly protein TadD
MKHVGWRLSILVLFLYGLQNFCYAQNDGDDIVIGTYKVMHSALLKEDRLLFIHLPRDYQDTRLHYPVLYLLYVDLYNYFTDAVMQVEKLSSSGEIPPLIIVGVVNTNRYRDLLPVPARGRPEGGGADNFLRFMQEELIPYIDQNYRTKNFRMLAGPQSAAIFTLYALIAKPETFNATVSENPFMIPENTDYLYPRAEQFFKNTKSLKHLLYIKCEKDERADDLEYASRFARLLESSKPGNFHFQVEFREPSGEFIDVLPFKEFLRLVFAGYKLPENFQTTGLKDLTNYYRERSAEYGFEVDLPEITLTFEGDKLRRAGMVSEAIEIFGQQLSLYPKSLNTFFQLGESYRALGDFETARRYYRGFLNIRDRDAAMIHRRLAEIDRMIAGSAAYRIEQVIRQQGLAAGLKKYQQIKSDTASALYFDENEFNDLGYRLMSTGNLPAAVEIFKINVDLYPRSANAYDSLGEAFMKRGDREQAILNYNKSLELNPGNENARAMLKNLENR